MRLAVEEVGKGAVRDVAAGADVEAFELQAGVAHHGEEPGRGETGWLFGPVGLGVVDRTVAGEVDDGERGVGPIFEEGHET